MTVISVDEAKQHLNVTFIDDDAIIQQKLNSVEEYVASYTGKAFLSQTITTTLDRFSTAIELPRAPVQSVTSITYLDNARTEQTLPAADYFLSPAGIVYPAIGKSWPATANVAGAVTVTFAAGYGANASDVPEPLKEAIRQLVAHWYENREAQTVPAGLTDLLAPYREWCF